MYATRYAMVSFLLNALRAHLSVSMRRAPTCRFLTRRAPTCRFQRATRVLVDAPARTCRTYIINKITLLYANLKFNLHALTLLIVSWQVFTTWNNENLSTLLSLNTFFLETKQ